MAHQARAMGRASTPRLSVFGHAFRRGVPYDAAKAAQIGSQLQSQLEPLKPLFQELQAACWDGGGQPAYVQAGAEVPRPDGRRTRRHVC
jgi:hypothetical protein